MGAKISSFEKFAKVTNHYLDESSKANYRSHISCKCVCFVNNSKCVNVLIKCNPKDTFEGAWGKNFKLAINGFRFSLFAKRTGEQQRK